MLQNECNERKKTSVAFVCRIKEGTNKQDSILIYQLTSLHFISFQPISYYDAYAYILLLLLYIYIYLYLLSISHSFQTTNH